MRNHKTKDKQLWTRKKFQLIWISLMGFGLKPLTLIYKRPPACFQYSQYKTTFFQFVLSNCSHMGGSYAERKKSNKWDQGETRGKSMKWICDSSAMYLHFKSCLYWSFSWTELIYLFDLSIARIKKHISIHEIFKIFISHLNIAWNIWRSKQVISNSDALLIQSHHSTVDSKWKTYMLLDIDMIFKD